MPPTGLKPMFGAEWITQVLGAPPVLGPVKGSTFSSISTDSRTIEEGALFLALRGQRFDGNDFAGEAIARGASGLVLERLPSSLPPGLPAWQVSEGLWGLQALAEAWRDELGCHVVAVTGSNGKTTTKEVATAVLAQRWKVSASPGNLNNQVGLPLALLQVPSQTKVAVLEMGTSQPGEIARLTEIARPEVGVITNIGPTHLEGLGTIQGVFEEKASLVRGLPSDGTAVLNGDQPQLRELAGTLACRSITFGLQSNNDVHPDRWWLDEEGRARLVLGGAAITLHLRGRHNLLNALAGGAVGLAFGLELEAVREGLVGVEPLPGRLAWEVIGGLTVLDDTYNANPTSLSAALEVLEGLRGFERRVAVLGEMKELGASTRHLHQRVGRELAKRELDWVVLVGEGGAAIAEGIGDVLVGGAGPRVDVAPDLEAAWECLSGGLEGREVVLFKGSRAVRLERLIERLRGDLGEGA